MKSRITDIITIFIIQLVLTIPFYTASVYGLSISNVRLTEVTAGSATVEWDTDIAANGQVRYGQTTSLGFKFGHDDFLTKHAVKFFNGIFPDTKFFFAVDSTDLNGTTATDNNSNNFYTFTTVDITPPPQVTGLSAVSATSNSVFLAWSALNISDFKHYIVYRNRVAVANTSINNFNDTNLTSATEFIYKITAVDTTGNEGPLSDPAIVSTLTSDFIAPVIKDVDVLSLTDTTAKVTWTTNENSTTIVLYGINNTDTVKNSDFFTINHSMNIEGLTKDAGYTFTVKSCDSSNNCANSSNHTFTSKKDVIAPSINISIPKCVNRRVIDIAGTTEPFSKVILFVNDMAIAKRILSSKETGSSGKFLFTQIQLEQSNIIKLVMEDKSGNINERVFDVSIDMKEPLVKLNEIPAIISKSNLSINGTVDEPVTLKIFVDANVNDSAVPPKVTGLNVTKIGKNSIELKWDESKDKDFSHYAVYRTNSGAIAITKPANFNLYIDALVDSGKSYTYQVSIINNFAVEGEKSEQVTATTLNGGEILNLNPPTVDILEDFRKPVLTVNLSANKDFNFGVKLGKGDGKYKVKAIFEDCADNSIVVEKNIILDTKKPDVKITSPPSGAFIFENVANQVNVIGKTKPNARVHLFVDRTPFSSFDQSIEVTGLPNEFQQTPEALAQQRFEIDIRDLPKKLENTSLPENTLDAKCRSGILASICPTGADFSVTADEQGNFKFENVDLTVFFGGAQRLTQVSPTNFQDSTLNSESRNSRTATIVVIATDQAGLRGTANERIRIGTCWSGNQSWDIIPMTQYQSPTLLSTERLRDGTETAYFYFNYSYIGSGTRPRIQSISISKACSNKEVLASRFNLSCELLSSGIPTKALNPPDNTVSYSAAPLARLPKLETFLGDDWKSFVKSIHNEITLPLKVTIRYQHDKDDDGKLETEVQTTCEEVSYVLDSSIIDPRKVLPDWLLYDFADFLQSSIKTLDSVQEQLNNLLNYVAIACLTSFVLKTALAIYRRWVTFADEKAFNFLNGAGDIAEKLGKLTGLFQGNILNLANDNGDDQQSCKDIIGNIAKEKKGWKLKYVNDKDLKKCFPSSDSAWKAEAKVYQSMRWSCDRVFGHSAPSRWTEAKNDDELLNKIASGEGCSVDQSVRGQPLRAEKCLDVISSFRTLKPDNYKENDKCFRLNTQNSKYLYQLGDQINGKLYNIELVTTNPSKLDLTAAIKRDETNYLTASTKSCVELCGVKKDYKEGPMTIDDQKVKGAAILSDPKPVKSGTLKKETVVLCTTVDNCKSYNKNPRLELGGHTFINPVASTAGYSQRISNSVKIPCFYDGDNAKAVSDSPAERQECCCINGKQAQETHYYQPDDIDPSDPTKQKQVHESTKPGESVQGEQTLGAKDFTDMKFSYRYYREKFEAKGATDGKEHTEYNPNRYIDGRDLPACFGANNLLYQAFQKEEEVLRVDPFRQHEAALQCAHIAGIINRIQFLKNIMTALSTCLIQVRTNGRGDSGACKELFTQYVCSSIWQVIRWFVDGCAPKEIGINDKEQDDNILGYVKNGFKGIYEGISDVQSEVSQEYGNAKLNELFGSGEESIARKICLGAFGYDWELNVKSLVDASYTTPFLTNVMAITRSREFLTVEPGSSKPKYEYRGSWIINPGCNFERYDVYLTCVGRKQIDRYPNNVDCGALGAPSIGYTGQFPGTGPSVAYSECDCMGLPDEKVGPSVFFGKLKQNVLEDKAIPSGKGVITSDVRYDHLKFVLKPDRRIKGNLKLNCYPTGYDEGIFYFPLTDKTARDIADCHVDPLSGSFICAGGQAYTTKKGTASFIDLKINDVDYTSTDELSFPPDTNLNILTTIRNVGPAKCLRATIDGLPEAILIDIEGINQYELTFSKPLVIGKMQQITPVTGLTIKEGILANIEKVSIEVRFYDTSPAKPDGIIDFAQDLIFIDGTKIEVGILSSGEQIVNQGKNPVAVSLDENNKLKLKKQNAEITILEAVIPRNQNGELNKGTVPATNNLVPTVGGTIFISTANDLAQLSLTSQSQTKKLVVALYNTRDNQDSLGFPDSCNFNDPVSPATATKKEINIRVEQKVTDTGLDKPRIKVIQPLPVKKDQPDPILVSADIIHRDGIRSAALSCTSPDNNIVPSSIGRSGSGSRYDFDIEKGLLNVAGKYNCKLSAVSNNQKSSEAEVKFQIEVMCGDNTGYGNCNKEGKCCNNNANCKNDEITGDLKCAVPVIKVETTTTTEPPKTETTKTSSTKPGISIFEYSINELPNRERKDDIVVDRVVLHHSNSKSAQATYNGLKSRSDQGDEVSIHYIIDKDGTIYYTVDESKTAFHVEDFNDRSIGIEIVNTGNKNDEYTGAQYISIKSLINDIADRHQPDIQVDNIHVIAHYQNTKKGKWDPSPNFDWSRIGLSGHILLADLGKKPPSDAGYG